MSLKKKIIGGTLLLVASAGVYFFWFRSEPAAVATERVKRSDVVETVSVTGELVPREYADLFFTLAGKVKAVLVEENDQVKKGSVIATQNSDSLEAQRAGSFVALQIAEENEKLARRDWDTLSPEERSAKKLATQQARENLRVLDVQIGNLVLRAPFDGRISKLSARSGEGVTFGTPIGRLVATDELIIEARIPESDITKVALGMEASVNFDALSKDEKFVATVTKIDPASTVIQGVVSYVAEFQLKDADERLKEGMTADIDIETGKRENVLVLPFRALSREGGKTFVEVKRDENSFEKVVVTTGLEGDDGTVEILSGLSGNEEVTIGARQVK